MHQEYDFSHHLSPSVAAGSLSLDMPSPVPPVDHEEQHEPEFINGDEVEEEVNNLAAVSVNPIQVSFIKILYAPFLIQEVIKG